MSNPAENHTSFLFYPHIIKIENDASSWKPTPHGVCLAEAMVGIGSQFEGKTVLEIGAGSGIHAILGCKLGCSSMDITEIEQVYLEEASANAEFNGQSFRKTLVEDWTNFEVEEKYDILICNPPFCKAGTEDRRWFIKQLIVDAKKFIKPDGFFIFSQSSMANFPLTEAEITENGYTFEVLLEHKNLFRDYYFTEPNFMEESAAVENGYEMIEGSYVETLKAYRVQPIA